MEGKQCEVGSPGARNGLGPAQGLTREEAGWCHGHLTDGR